MSINDKCCQECMYWVENPEDKCFGLCENEELYEDLLIYKDGMEEVVEHPFFYTYSNFGCINFSKE